MKGVLVEAFGPIESASFTEIPDPAAGPGQVVVDVYAAEANFPDFLVMQGDYQFRPPLPFSPGKAAAGLVAETGEGVSHVKPGDRVAVQVEYGAYAEKVVAAAGACFPMPDDVSFEVGAALGLVYQTAHFALVDRAGFRPGESVLVLSAAGGIGTATAQLAKAMGASVVIGGVRGRQKIATATANGCDHVIDVTAPDLRDRMREEIYRVTDGKGVDVVVDPVGGDVTAAALRALAWRGRLVVVGFAAGEIPSFQGNYLLLKNIAVSGLQWSDYRERTPDWVAKVQAELFDFYLQGKIDPPITEILPLARYADALRRLKDGRAEGKIVLKVRDG